MKNNEMCVSVLLKSEQKGNAPPPGVGVPYRGFLPPGLGAGCGTAYLDCARDERNYLQAPTVRPPAFGRAAPEKRRGMEGESISDWFLKVRQVGHRLRGVGELAGWLDFWEGRVWGSRAGGNADQRGATADPSLRSG